jgi:hypothetical protein
MPKHPSRLFQVPGAARFTDAEYSGWRGRRFEAIGAYYGAEFFRGKTLLELGAGCGHFGQLFHKLGAKVTCWEGRPENVDQLRQLHPDLDAYVRDLDTEPVFGDWDVILHQGLLYHLTNLDVHLQNVCAHTRCLILETHVVDSAEDQVYLEDEPLTLCDSSIHGVGSRPTLAWVENRLRENGFDPLRCPNRERLDFRHHHYNWEPANTGDLYRRMLWFAEKR